MKLKRIGKIAISITMAEEHPEQVSAVLHAIQFIPLRGEFLYHRPIK